MTGTIEGMVQVCLNGPRGAADGAMVPLVPEVMAQSAAEAVAAGATDIHAHPTTPCGQDTLSPRGVAATLVAIRAQVRVPVGVTTGSWAEPDPAARSARVRGWTVLPDHASVNWHEPGAEELAATLLDLGVQVEADIWSGTDGAARFAVSPLAPKVLRVLAEVTDTDADTAEESARALLTDLGDAQGRPVLLHGENGGAWPVLRLAGRLGLAPPHRTGGHAGPAGRGTSSAQRPVGRGGPASVRPGRAHLVGKAAGDELLCVAVQAHDSGRSRSRPGSRSR